MQEIGEKIKIESEAILIRNENIFSSHKTFKREFRRYETFRGNNGND
jgi:hypothetical protein